MKVLISRASISDYTICPVDGAERVGVHYYHYAIKDLPSSMFEEAKTHIQKICTDIEKLDNGDIRGIDKEERQRWAIDIDDLFQFAKEHGRVIVGKCNYIAGDWYEVIIYDDYIE